MKHREHVGRDLLLYIVIGLLVATAAIGYGVYCARRGEKPDFKNDWFVTIATAALAFGNTVKSHWALRRLWSLWAVLFTLLVAHFAFLLSIFSRMVKVPLLLIAMITPLEIVVLCAVLDFALGHFDSRT
jgi:hypothetical protein